ncbi:TPA: hypothetical protein DCG86_02265 [Candidatus Marinimicrobia bacterium]|nr:MAG: hypothetical protein XD77_1036 [Marinimicrobia bacterium 46_47]KUK92217.1 MAG: hypothetical protein XE04_0638 [Marinimicrobia bacterium 46_43]HAE86829.1 hypothetical protein [Candidatus Neomarinimicrobiota bacterium]HBY17585.1 hypothetical protein [Candidatus Neomarinimicrobiota bacterium]
MNPTFNKNSQKTVFYRDNRLEHSILKGLAVLVCAAVLILFIRPAEKEKTSPDDFMNQASLFLQDSVRYLRLVKMEISPKDSVWTLEFEYPEGKVLRGDLYRFGLFCGDHLKACTARIDSQKTCITLTIRDQKERLEGRIILRTEARALKGRICLIIDDFGYAYSATEKGFLNLRAAVTFSIIPGHTHSKSLARLAHQQGHPVMIHMPMEPLKYRGGEEEYMIMDGMDRNEIEYRILKAINGLPMAVGMNNHMGSRVTGSVDMIHKIADVLETKDLIFVDSYTANKTVVQQVMRAHHIRVYQRDIFIDHENSESSIRRQIDKMARMAEKKGVVVAIGHNRPMTLKILTEMIPKLEKEGFRFISPGEL